MRISDWSSDVCSSDLNWTDAGGVVNAAYADEAIANFAGTGGAVTIDNSLGDVRASGMQFAAAGYEIGGVPVTLVGPQETIRAGDVSTAGTEFTATLAAGLPSDQTEERRSEEEYVS